MIQEFKSIARELREYSSVEFPLRLVTKDSSDESTTSLSVSPCGYSDSVCASTPSIFTTLFYFLFPFASMIWYGVLRSMCAHPFIGLAWFFACVCHQIAELFTFFRIFQMLRAKEVTIGTVLKEELVFGYLHWLFWGPCLIALFTGYLLPNWCSYIVLLVLTGVALWSSLSFVLEFLRGIAGPPANANPNNNGGAENSSNTTGEQQQQGSTAAGMD